MSMFWTNVREAGGQLTFATAQAAVAAITQPRTWGELVLVQRLR